MASDRGVTVFEELNIRRVQVMVLLKQLFTWWQGAEKEKPSFATLTSKRTDCDMKKNQTHVTTKSLENCIVAVLITKKEEKNNFAAEPPSRGRLIRDGAAGASAQARSPSTWLTRESYRIYWSLRREIPIIPSSDRDRSNILGANSSNTTRNKMQQ